MSNTEIATRAKLNYQHEQLIRFSKKSTFHGRAVVALLGFHEKVISSAENADVTPLLFRLHHPPELLPAELLNIDRLARSIIACEAEVMYEER